MNARHALAAALLALLALAGLASAAPLPGAVLRALAASARADASRHALAEGLSEAVGTNQVAHLLTARSLGTSALYHAEKVLVRASQEADEVLKTSLATMEHVGSSMSGIMDNRMEAVWTVLIAQIHPSNKDRVHPAAEPVLKASLQIAAARAKAAALGIKLPRLDEKVRTNAMATVQNYQKRVKAFGVPYRGKDGYWLPGHDNLMAAEALSLLKNEAPVTAVYRYGADEVVVAFIADQLMAGHYFKLGKEMLALVAERMRLPQTQWKPAPFDVSLVEAMATNPSSMYVRVLKLDKRLLSYILRVGRYAPAMMSVEAKVFISAVTGPGVASNERQAQRIIAPYSPLVAATTANPEAPGLADATQQHLRALESEDDTLLQPNSISGATKPSLAA